MRKVSGVSFWLLDVPRNPPQFHRSRYCRERKRDLHEDGFGQPPEHRGDCQPSRSRPVLGSLR